jgi:hypothetical protein
VVEIRRLVPSPDVRNEVESGPASQRGLKGALRQERPLVWNRKADLQCALRHLFVA